MRCSERAACDRVRSLCVCVHVPSVCNSLFEPNKSCSRITAGQNESCAFHRDLVSNGDESIHSLASLKNTHLCFFPLTDCLPVG